MIGEDGGGPTSSYSRSRIQSLSTSSYDTPGSPPAPRPPTGSAKASRRGMGSAAAAGIPAWGCPAAPVAGLGRDSCLSRWAARPWGGFDIAVGGALWGWAAGRKGRAGDRLGVGGMRGGCSRFYQGEGVSRSREGGC